MSALRVLAEFSRRATLLSAAVANGPRATFSSTPCSISCWRSSLSAPQRRNSHAIAPSVTSEPSIIIIVPASPWSRSGERLVELRAVVIHAVDRLAGPDEDVAENRLEQADGDDVAELRRGAEPRRPGQHLDHRRPHERAGREEAEVLERVDGVVTDRTLVEKRDVPDVEVQRPERQARRAVSERPRRRPGEREQRPQERSR